MESPGSWGLPKPCWGPEPLWPPTGPPKLSGTPSHPQVYTILLIQLLVTLGVVALFTFW